MSDTDTSTPPTGSPPFRARRPDHRLHAAPTRAGRSTTPPCATSATESGSRSAPTAASRRCMLGAAAQQTGGVLYTDRPPPRFRGAPTRLGVPRHVDGRSGHGPVRHAADAAAHARRRRAGRARRRRCRQVAGSRSRMANAVAAVVHRRRTHRGGRTARLRRLGQVGRCRRRAGHPRRVPQSRRRRPGAVPHLPPRARHRGFPRSVCHRIDAVAGTRIRHAGEPIWVSATACSALAVELALQAARQVARRGRCRLPAVVEDSASAARIIAPPVQVVRSSGQRLPSAKTSPVQYEPSVLAEMVHGRELFVRARRVCRWRPKPVPVRRFRRRSPTAGRPRSGCRGPAPRSRPTARRCGSGPPRRAARRRAPGSTTPSTNGPC